MFKIYRLICIFAFVFSCPMQTFAQGDRPKIGKVSGKIVDAQSDLPVEYATVSLHRLKDSSLVSGAVSTEKGEFLMEALPFGKFFLKISFIGFETSKSDTFSIFPKNPEKYLGILKLNSSVQRLDEVEIKAEKEVMELRADRKIFNVDKSLVSVGGSATDILQNIPSVSVDIDGGITLRGSGNVNVLIDGKPSSLTGSDRAAVLKQIPASSIERIEVITNPSARYDPDGTAGIINVILKKNQNMGFNGNASLSIGTLNKYNGSLNLNYKTKNANWFANYSYRYNDLYGNGGGSRKNMLTDTTFYQNQTSKSNNHQEGNLLKTGVDLTLNTKNNLTLAVLYNNNLGSGFDGTDYNLLDNNQLLKRFFVRNSDDRGKAQNFDFTMNYRKTFTTPRRELTADVIYSTGENENTGFYRNLDYFLPEKIPYPSPSMQQNSLNKGKNNIFTAQIDYSSPIGKEGRLETGYKNILRTVDNDFRAENFNNTENVWKNDNNWTNHFVYTEKIFSTYGIYSSQVKNFAYQIGLRLEQTFTNSELVLLKTNVENNYFSFLPTIHLSQKLANEQEIQLSYSRRLNRPSPNNLNPTIDFGDPLNLRTGNPKLNPEYIHSIELGYSKIVDKFTLTSSIYYRLTTNAIQRIRTVDNLGIATTTFGNVNDATAYGFEVVAKNDFTKWWNLTSNFNFFKSIINGATAAISSQTTSWTFKVISNMKIAKKVDIQFTGNYQAPVAIAQGTRNGFYGVDLGLKTDILQGKGSLTLNISDVFDNRRFVVFNSAENFSQDFTRKRESRIATLSFSYRFGKSEMSNKRRPRSDEQRQGGGDEF